MTTSSGGRRRRIQRGPPSRTGLLTRLSLTVTGAGLVHQGVAHAHARRPRGAEARPLPSGEAVQAGSLGGRPPAEQQLASARGEPPPLSPTPGGRARVSSPEPRLRRPRSQGPDTRTRPPWPGYSYSAPPPAPRRVSRVTCSTQFDLLVRHFIGVFEQTSRQERARPLALLLRAAASPRQPAARDL